MGAVISGARIPELLQKQLKDFCQGHGLKIGYFVSKAIEEKLSEAKEDEKDIAFFELLPYYHKAIQRYFILPENSPKKHEFCKMLGN